MQHCRGCFYQALCESCDSLIFSCAAQIDDPQAQNPDQVASGITKKPVSPPPEVTLTIGEFDRRTNAPQTFPASLSVQSSALIQAPIIMMSQNRAEARDRLRAENDYKK